MILAHLIHFFVVSTVQLFFFLFQLKVVKSKIKVISALKKGVIIGLPFGITFDLIVGKYFSVFTYEIGFPLWFLVLNGLLSYGFMFANVFLFQETQKEVLHHAYGWVVSMAIVYEIANHFFPVWEWTFLPTIYLEYAVVIMILYPALAWLMMLSLRIIYKAKLKLIPF